MVKTNLPDLHSLWGKTTLKLHIVEYIFRVKRKKGRRILPFRRRNYGSASELPQPENKHMYINLVEKKEK